MKSLLWKLPVALLLLLGGGLGLASTAQASHVNVRITESTDAVVGQPVQLQAHFTSASTGQPVAGAVATFYMQGDFIGVSGDVEIGRSVTNQDGIATITYEPRDAGQHQVRVDYTLANDTAVEHAPASINVADAPGQVFQQTAGVRVPGLNRWLIIAIASLIWAILFGVAVTVVRIARAAGADDPEERQPSFRPGRSKLARERKWQASEPALRR